MSKIKITAHEGYKYKDERTGKAYSEVITNDKDRRFFTLVPDNSEKPMEV